MHEENLMKINSEMISLNISDGTKMSAFTARPDDGKKYPGLLLFQEAFGVNDHIKDLAKRFANEGYVAVAPELFHRTAPGFQGDYNNFPSVMPHIQALNQSDLTADITASYEWLTGNSHVKKDQIVSTGYCMGGRVSVLANLKVHLKASVSYYGSAIAKTMGDQLQNSSGPLLLFWGGLDKNIGKDQIDDLTSRLTEHGKVFTNVIFSNAGHAFFCDARSSYNPDAAKQAWVLTLEFFKQHLPA